jgi:hypothetical protein
MSALRSSTFQFGLMLATALAVSTLPAAGQGYSPEQEQACSGDAMRLCSAYIPDVGRITACMIQNKSQLSPPCRAHFRPEPSSRASSVRTARPLSIKPATARKPVSAKPKKPRKPRAT